MTEVQTKVEGPKIHHADIQAALAACKFEVDQVAGRTATHVHVYDPQGYYLASGFSACVDPQNFDAKLGQDYALKDALGKAEDKLWQLEGYHLKKELEAGRYILNEEDEKQPPHIQRVLCERNDLMRNFSLLATFVEACCPGVQDVAEKDLLREQGAAQYALIEILDKRLALAGIS